MPRKPRDRSPGIHHVNAAATGDEPLFRDEIDRLTWVRTLVRVLRRFEWTCLIFCQLTNHWHLVVDVPDESLPRGMHMLNSDYGREFNDRHGRRGSLQRARYWSEAKPTPEAAVAAFRYVALNPVEAGLARRAEDWPWSSFATSCGGTNAFPFVDASRVIEELGGDPAALLRLVS